MELNDLKTMLQINDDKRDKILSLIVKNTTQALRLRLGLKPAADIPSELDYIVLEVSVRRYNRLANEGMKSYTQEGESITFNSDDFADFAADIEAWKDDKDKPSSTGRFVFL